MYTRLAGLALAATAVIMVSTGPNALAEPMKYWGCAPTAAPGDATTHTRPMLPWGGCQEHGPVTPQTVATGVPINEGFGS